MTRSELLKALPASLRRALEAGDFATLLGASEAQAQEDADGTTLALWRIAQTTRTVDAMRVLSYHLVRNLVGAVAEAARLWLLQEPIEDATTLVNILTGLTVASVERKGIADYQLAVLPDLVSRCLQSPEESVRISVLDFLRDNAAAQGWPRRIGRTAARRLAKALKERLADDVVEEEVEELQHIVDGLRSDVIPVKPPIKQATVNKLIESLKEVPGTEDLAKAARVRRLRDSAQAQAQRDDRPVLTVRVCDGVDGLLSRVKQVFELCRLEHIDPTTDVWLIAPAASESRHLRGRPETTRGTFDRLKVAAKIAGNEIDSAGALGDMPPRQANAVASLLRVARDSGAQAEFTLTPPDVGDEPAIVEFTGAGRSYETWRQAAAAAERSAAEHPEIYSKEVPQANTVGQVLQAVDAVLARGEVRLRDIDNVGTPRQIDYYVQAARALGFLDDDSEPTPLARELKKAKKLDRLAVAAMAFDCSMVGRAWRAWAKAARLRNVPPSSAEAFLHDRAIGITGATIPRRASTLRKWHTELLPYYQP